MVLRSWMLNTPRPGCIWVVVEPMMGLGLDRRRTVNEAEVILSRFVTSVDSSTTHISNRKA